MKATSKNALGFLKNRKGNVAPFFGLMAIPMFAITGGSIDIGQAINAQARMQQAIDAAAVAVCTNGGGSQTSEEILRAFLGSELDGTGLTIQAPDDQGDIEFKEVKLENPNFDPVDGSLNPKISSMTQTTLLKLIGINQIPIEAETMVKCGAKRLELSLVLDVTGSMNNWSGGKKRIDSMKDAGLDVLDIFGRNLDAGVTRIALVPFSEGVNVGNLADKVRGTLKNGKKKNAVGWQKLRFKDQYNSWATWKASQCVSERLGFDAYTDAPPNCSGTSCTAPVGHVYTSNGDCRPGNEVQPLTNDKTLLRQQILSYQPAGNTAGQVGTAWGWYTLSDKWSDIFTGTSTPEAPNPDELIKATIIMTDGEFNTEFKLGVQDRYTDGSAENGSSSYQFQQMCNAMKQTNAAGDAIVVYTIGFGMNPSGQTAQRLKDCATDDTKYFFPYNGEQLRAAFVSIGKQLSGGQAGQALVQK